MEITKYALKLQKLNLMPVKLLEISQIGQERAGILDLPQKYWPQPGQYLPCQRLDGPPEILTTHLFRVFGFDNALALGPLPPDWFPGDRLSVLPPKGQGFDLPTSAQRVGLVALDISPTRLLTLVKPALSMNASVALFCDPSLTADIFDRIPPAVEVAAVSDLRDNLNWPDFLAVDLKRESLAELSNILSEKGDRIDGQVLVRTPMPCRGLGECGVCAVRTKQGWQLACKDGPVFPLKELLNVAQ